MKPTEHWSIEHMLYAYLLEPLGEMVACFEIIPGGSPSGHSKTHPMRRPGLTSFGYRSKVVGRRHLRVGTRLEVTPRCPQVRFEAGTPHGYETSHLLTTDGRQMP